MRIRHLTTDLTHAAGLAASAQKLEGDESEAHASADWANPHQLKQQFLGLGSGVRFR